MNKSIHGIKGRILISTVLVVLITVVSISSIAIYQINKKTMVIIYVIQKNK